MSPELPIALLAGVVLGASAHQSGPCAFIAATLGQPPQTSQTAGRLASTHSPKIGYAGDICRSTL